MKRIKERFLSRKGTKRTEIFLGVLITLAPLLQPCLAVLTPNYIAMNQADKRLNNPGVSGFGNTLAYGDFLFVNDTTWSPGSTGETITSWKWNLSNLSDPSDFVLKSDRNASFGPFVKDSSSYLLNLTVTASDSSTYSPPDMVYQVSDHRSFVSVYYTAVPAYDDRGPANPNGTITFWDESYPILDPMISITEWWWKWTDLSTGVSKSISGQDHFTEDMTDTEFMVNLTVNNSQGNCVSITDITNIPPDNVYPIANFSVIPKNGVLPLEVGITDQALSMVNYTLSDVPLSYNYTVWNETGENVFGTEFNTKNANVTLTDPGVYRIIQNVTNSFGKTDDFSVDDIIVSPPGGPIANFSASVREGLAPLNVTLIDQTIGIGPYKYDWKIGNSSGIVGDSTINNPQFALQYPGKYWINLSVTDPYGFDFENKTDFITVGVEKYPKAAFTAVPMNGSYPLNVSFIDQSVLDPDLLATIGPANYTWTFDDGGESHLQNPTHLFTSARDYTVSMNLSHGVLQAGPATQTIHVYEPSDSGINFTWVQEYGKTAYSTVLIPLGITADWTLNWVVEKDGTIYSPVDSSAFTPRYDLPETGEYSVTMTASKDGFTSVGKNQQMEVFPNVPPSPEITMESPFDSDTYSAYAFAGDPIQFWSNRNDSMEDSWEWDFGDNSSSSLRSPVHSYNAPGLYTVTLKASNVKGETAADINQLPYIPYTVLDTYNVWILNDIIVSPTAAYPPSRNMPLEVQFDAIVNVSEKSDPESRKYIDRWYWDFDKYSIQGSSSEERPTFTYYDPGIYTPVVWVQLINDYWGMWRGPFELPPIHVLSNTPIKPGFTYEEIDRTGTYGYSYKFMDRSKSYTYGSPIDGWSWDFGDRTLPATEPAPTHLFKEPGSYTVTLTVWDSAAPIPNTAKTSKIVTISDNSVTYPIPLFTADVQSGSVPLTVHFSDQSQGDIVQWNWNFGDGLMSHESHDQNPTHHYLLPGVYDVSLEVIDSTNGRGEITSTGFIQVNP